ncbi:MAG: hypothetical protein H5T72_08865 [Actinobacteria bacterium]|nr:hypothetical protein [Actinomycetota bacterium]
MARKVDRGPLAAEVPMDERERFPRWDEVRFAHRSEQEFARLLDFYDIKWLYEPVSFDIAWDKKGNPVSKFTPDFYLPEFDLYIEITTMNQKLVTKKNRKIRRLMELYPEVKCKILYRKDFEHLLFKYHINLGGPEEGEVPVVMLEGDPSEDER